MISFVVFKTFICIVNICLILIYKSGSFMWFNLTWWFHCFYLSPDGSYAFWGQTQSVLYCPNLNKSRGPCLLLVHFWSLANLFLSACPLSYTYFSGGSAPAGPELPCIVWLSLLCLSISSWASHWHTSLLSPAGPGLGISGFVSHLLVEEHDVRIEVQQMPGTTYWRSPPFLCLGPFPGE